MLVRGPGDSLRLLAATTSVGVPGIRNWSIVGDDGPAVSRRGDRRQGDSGTSLQAG
jgi:hypothetical protein